LAKIGENWRKLAKIGENWRKRAKKRSSHWPLDQSPIAVSNPNHFSYESLYVRRRRGKHTKSFFFLPEEKREQDRLGDSIKPLITFLRRNEEG
jgi:hypothetical protein